MNKLYTDEDIIDSILTQDLMRYGTAFVKLTVDQDGNVIRERLDPVAMIEATTPWDEKDDVL